MQGPFCYLVTVYNATGFEEASKCFPGRVPNLLRNSLASGASVSRETGQNYGASPFSASWVGEESASQSPGNGDQAQARDPERDGGTAWLGEAGRWFRVAV